MIPHLHGYHRVVYSLRELITVGAALDRLDLISSGWSHVYRAQSHDTTRQGRHLAAHIAFLQDVGGSSIIQWQLVYVAVVEENVLTGVRQESGAKRLG